MTTNGAELAIVLMGMAAVALGGWAIPILAIQILAIDLLAEVMPLTFLTFDPSADGVMKHGPRDQRKHIMNRQNSLEIGFLGLLIGALAFGNYALYMLREGITFSGEITGGNIHYARATTLSYLTIGFCQFVNVLSRRYRFTSLFNRNFFGNRILLWSIAGSIVLILVAIYTPLISGFLYFHGPRPSDWMYVLGAAGVFLAVFELLKARKRSARRRDEAAPA
jgi:Ca2+-transporting ATPase